MNENNPPLILYVSDISMEGSGYTSIGLGLCRELHGWQGHEVLALSLGYRNQEHYEPFRIVPSLPRWCSGQINSLCADPSTNVKAVIVALDITQILDLTKLLKLPPYIPLLIIFPVESDPLTDRWSIGLWRANERFVISEFGKRVCEEKGLPVHYLPIPPAAEYTPVTRTRREQTRTAWDIPQDAFLVLTVADNQERKNLWRAMEIVSKFAQEHPETFYILVTRPDSPIGYLLDDAVRELGLSKRIKIVDRGITNAQLADLYGAADVFLLTSKAEGLGLPVREAQACGLLVAATDCTGVSEQIEDARGFPILVDYVHRDPWGNSNRYFASLGDGVEVLRTVHDGIPSYLLSLRQAAQDYVQGFSWEKSAKIIKDALWKHLTQVTRNPD